MTEPEQHINANQTAAYIDWIRKEGKPPEKEVLEHVASCQACKQEILELAGVLDDLDQNEKKSGRQAWLNPLIRVAAVLAGVTIVALAIQFFRHPSADQAIAGQDQDSTQITPTDHQVLPDSTLQEPTASEPVMIIQHDTVLYAANFEPDTGLEILMESHFRSDGGNDRVVQQAIFKTGSRIKLSDLTAVDSGDEFTLLNNRGEMLRRLKRSDWTQGLILDYQPGLYYWKITDQRGILLSGRFKLFSVTD